MLNPGLAFILLLLLSGLASCSGEKRSDAWQIVSEERWFDNSGLLNVESILYDSASKTYYASNGVNYRPGSDGFLSKFSFDKDQFELKWVEGLSRPTGMALIDSFLYVADVNVLVVINAFTGEIISRHPEPILNSGLNDVAINQEGQVFVTASFIHAVLRLEEGGLVVWRQDTTKLQWANGILAETDRVIVGGQYLSHIDLASREINIVELSSPVRDFDGLTSDGRRGYFLSTVENRGLYYWDGNQTIRSLSLSGGYYGDFAFDVANKKLLIPRGTHQPQEYYISEFSLGDGQ